MYWRRPTLRRNRQLRHSVNRWLGSAHVSHRPCRRIFRRNRSRARRWRMTRSSGVNVAPDHRDRCPQLAEQ
jgi:hypothetical protein